MIMKTPYFMTNKEWFRKNPETGKLELTEKATPEAIKSFKEYFERYNKMMDYLYSGENQDNQNEEKAKQLFGL